MTSLPLKDFTWKGQKSREPVTSGVRCEPTKTWRRETEMKIMPCIESYMPSAPPPATIGLVPTRQCWVLRGAGNLPNSAVKYV